MKFIIKLTILIVLLSMYVSDISTACFMPISDRDTDMYKKNRQQLDGCIVNEKKILTDLRMDKKSVWDACQSSVNGIHGDMEHGTIVTDGNFPHPGLPKCKNNNRYFKIFTWADNRISENDTDYYNAIRLGTIIQTTEEVNHLKYQKPVDYETWKVARPSAIMVTSAPLGKPVDVRDKSLIEDLKEFIFPKAYNPKICNNLGEATAPVTQGKFSRDQSSEGSDNRNAFWNATITNKITMGVQLTNFIEAKNTSPGECTIKADLYYPLKAGKQETYGDITVKCTDLEKKTSYNIRKLDIIKNNVTTKFVHFQYQAWPDQGVPSGGALSEIKAIAGIAAAQIKADAGSVIAHCTGGVGRTGTFVSLVTFRGIDAQYKKTWTFNLLKYMYRIRMERTFLIETFEQYNLLADDLSSLAPAGRKLK